MEVIDEQKDGGPAFPTMTISESVGRAGMTMRQYYKAHALIGLVIENEADHDSPLAGWSVNAVADAAGIYATAMIAEDEANKAGESRGRSSARQALGSRVAPVGRGPQGVRE